MTTPNIEELRKLAEAASVLDHSERMQWYTEQDLMPSAFYEKNARFMAALTPPTVIALLDALQSQAERIADQQRLWDSLNVYCGQAERQRDDAIFERDEALTRLAALQSDDELPESPYVVDALRRVWTRVGFANPNDGENLFTADQLRQAQAKVRAKMVPLEKDADMFWNDDDAERNHNSIDEFLNEEICNGMGVEVGGEFTLRCAMSLPKIKIRVTSIDEEACEAEYEIIPDGITGEPK